MARRFWHDIHQRPTGLNDTAGRVPKDMVQEKAAASLFSLLLQIVGPSSSIPFVSEQLGFKYRAPLTVVADSPVPSGTGRNGEAGKFSVGPGQKYALYLMITPRKDSVAESILGLRSSL
jgi:hypothetical protein